MSIYKISLSLSVSLFLLPPPLLIPHYVIGTCALDFFGRGGGGGGGGGGGVVQLSVRRSMHLQESSDSLLVFR